jgi:hypothetical protein
VERLKMSKYRKSGRENIGTKWNQEEFRSHGRRKRLLEIQSREGIG